MELSFNTKMTGLQRNKPCPLRVLINCLMKGTWWSNSRKSLVCTSSAILQYLMAYINLKTK
jgi:hypothetical protein